MSLQSFASDRPAIAVVGGHHDDLAILEKIAGSVGRVTSRSLLDEAVAPETRFASIVLLDASDVAGSDTADAVERIASETPSTTQLVVRTSLANVDLIDAICPRGQLVIGRDDNDLRLALVSSLAAQDALQASTLDVATDEGMRLQRLADEIARIARTLVDLPDGLGGPRPQNDPIYDIAGTPAIAIDTTAAVTATEVRAIIRSRRMRDRYFPAELFADPAWDMLLDLAAARIERVRVAVSSLCIAAAVPPTTALRWIKAMTDKGLLRRVADPHDARRIFIQLSDDAAAAMEQYLRAVRGGAGLAI